MFVPKMLSIDSKNKHTVYSAAGDISIKYVFTHEHNKGFCPWHPYIYI